MNEQPVLQTRRLTLRPFTLADAPHVQAMAGDQRVSQMILNMPYPYQDGMAETWISSHSELYASRRAIVYAAVLSDTKELIGTISLNQLTEKDGNLGYWLGVPYWGKGYCSEAVEALVEFGFKKLGLPLIYARHLEENLASGRVITKNGFQHKGSMSVEVNGHMRISEYYERKA